jgi:hypothetical protein
VIFGRPINLVIGAGGALLNLVVLAAKQIDPTGVGAFFTAEIILALNTAFAALVAVIAGQPPAVQVGSQINVTTPSGQPNVLATVNSPNELTPVPLPPGP